MDKGKQELSDLAGPDKDEFKWRLHYGDEFWNDVGNQWKEVFKWQGYGEKCLELLKGVQGCGEKCLRLRIEVFKAEERMLKAFERNVYGELIMESSV